MYVCIEEGTNKLIFKQTNKLAAKEQVPDT